MDKLNNTFTDCSCISADPYVKVELGACAKDCTSTLIPYLVVIFVITMVTCCAQTPAIFVTLRCVNEDERPIAMGCQYLLLRLIAYIPVSIRLPDFLPKITTLQLKLTACRIVLHWSS